MDPKKLKDIILNFASEIVDKPEVLDVQINAFGESACEILIYPDIEDVRLIVGKQGRNIQALRTLIHCLAAKHGMRVYVKCDAKN